MGRQIEFVHIEDDIIPFLREFEKNGGCIIYNYDLKPMLAHSETIISQMSTRFSKYNVIPRCTSYSLSDSCNVLSGTIVEFSNSRKGNSLSRTYEVGRLFIMQMPEGSYEPNAVMLYNKMCEYIKSNYFYSRSAKIYYSPSFKKEYDRHYYYVARLGKKVIL